VTFQSLTVHAALGGLTKKILLEGVGHSAAEEQPEKVKELLLAFLEGLKHV
jgi:pimeloyl-ACP methyl ester carboxylesterase